MRPAIALQAKGEAFYFIADYHALTTIDDPETFRANSRRVALDFLACGLDPDRGALFRQSDVPQVTELRRQLRENKSEYLVVKNTLALIAVKDSPLTKLKEHFVGPTAVAFNATDAVVLAKTLTKFAKEVPAVLVKQSGGGYGIITRYDLLYTVATEAKI